MIIVEFTKEEAQIQLQLNDIAVKAGGLSVAEAAVVLSKKLQTALQAVESKEEVPQTAEE